METETAKLNILFNLTEKWLERPSDGPRNKGKLIRYRYFILCSTYEWSLNEEREGIHIAHAHAARFADLAPSFKTVALMDPVECLQRVALSLGELTGQKLELDMKDKKGVELWIELGRQIDSFYKVNYAIDEGVKKKLFGTEGDEDEE